MFKFLQKGGNFFKPNFKVRHLRRAPFFQYGGSPQFLNFYKMAVIFKPNFKVRHLRRAPFFQYGGSAQFLNF